MFRTKKFLNFIVTLSLIFIVLVACNGNKNVSNSIEENANENKNGQQEEPYTISIMAKLHTPETPNEKLLKLLEDATNTKLDIQWVPDNNYDERLSTAFATGSLPQVVAMNFNSFVKFKDAIRADQFWEVGPYLDEFENLSKLKEEILANTMVDGKLYSLYQGRPLSRQGMIYRKDWADKLGLSAPTNTDEFYEMLRAFSEDDPNGSGTNDTIGLTDRSDLIYGAFKTVASWYGTPNEWGEKDGQLLPEFMFPAYMDTLNFLREVHSNGYINQDFPVTSKTDQQALFKNGTAGVYVGSMADVEGLYNDAITLNPDLELDVQNYVEGPQGEFGVWSIPGFNGILLFPKSEIETEDDLRKILGFYDQLMTPEVANLLVWGVEGEHYTVKDGRALPNADNQKKIDTEVRPYLSLEIGEPETSGRYEGYFTYEVKAKAEELIKDNENYLIKNPTVTLDSETFIQNSERLKLIMVDATYKYILGQIDEEGFEKAITDWKNQGGDKVIEEFNTHYQQIN
ncbi:extracellular solute-binding protein [Bacillus solitudinis]|uniref:extracellular solute-binding protein n=1 Tax=Bacillus solitudinis TaxID=2014074 RepID=UPI000C233276|nr:extracellular solute-binding protein [Bacillus solitudinis]